MNLPASSVSGALPSIDGGEAVDFGAAIQAFMLAQLRQIDDQLGERRHPHRAIHEVRKAVRRFRSMLALCVDVSPKRFDALDKRVRRVGKRLSALRDAHVLVGTAASVRRRDGREAIWLALDLWLRRERRQLLDSALADDPEFAVLRRRAVRAARALAGIDFSGLGGKAVVRALRASAAEMAKAEQKASEHPRAAIRHRWRRRVRRLRLQLEGLAAIGEDALLPIAVRIEAQWVLSEALSSVPSAAALAVLADRLGERQDVENLAVRVKRHDELPHREDILAALKARQGPRRAQ
ncbi:MAG TPA: CHAD domain-containing protein [Tahibacter sp.]|uniref:CHAD domain-containing protein n=1 Tax=Tahibacter sp. TaxID=2056211 RepID=UPI002C29D514|nr:CHAD domain-containing protein [Tahibacter sp.]HSX62775.1 CHAD domain-containing protein [Tahibacter sp.]